MKQILYITITLLLTACGTGRIKSTETVKPTESIVFGKLTVLTNKPIKKRTLDVLFNEKITGKYHVRPDDSGYFYMKLPLHKNNMLQIGYMQNNNHLVNIVKGYFSIDIPESGTIYYAGDITIDLRGLKHTGTSAAAAGAAGGAIGGIIGAIADNSKKPQTPPIKIAETQSTIDYFKRKFPTNKRTIATHLALVSPVAN